LQKIHGTQKQRQTETPKFPIESRGHVICSSTELWAHKNMQKNAMEEKKIRRIQILAGQKANQNTWTNSKNRANIKIKTRKYGYVHVIDLHKQMSKGWGGGDGGGRPQEMQSCGRSRNRTEQKLERAKAHQEVHFGEIPSCIWILECRQS